MRLGVAALLLIVIASCSQAAQPNPTSPAPDPRAAAASQALDAVWASLDRSAIFDAFPRKAGIEACVINIGPPPGRDVAATCSTAVQPQGPHWLVTFTEVWDGRAFHAMGSSHDGPLIYTWQFTVDDDDVIVRQVHSGDFPPQLVF